MLTSKVQLGCVLTRGGGQAVQGGLSCPPPRISERKDNQQILLHDLLQEYLVERDTNFISVSLRCLLQMFSWVTYWQGGGASCPGRFILPSAQNFREKGQSANFITPSTTGIFSWKRYKLYFSQYEMLTSNVQLGYVLTRSGGQAVQGSFSCPPPPPRISNRMDNQQILLHHPLQELLVERDINFISISLRCLFQMFTWVTYWKGVGGKVSRAVYLPPPPPRAQNFGENG